jgi:hypothetical protein
VTTKNARALAAIVAGGALLIPATSIAATPKLGTYVGQVAGKTVTLKVLSAKTAKYTFDCGSSGGPVGAYTKAPIKKGRFSGADRVSYGSKSALSSLSGRFTSSTKAVATFKVSLCDGKGGSVTLLKQG